ncbi:MAG: IS200/IS605 family transposase [Spirochaetes bacterium]|nr:IS200/IS605 family transposase [Spirochaetota bacterium]
MSHSYYNLWIHLVFSTKGRRPLIAENIQNQIYKFMAGELNENGCSVKIINGMPDHVHILFTQNPSMSIAQIVKNLKGVSSHRINQNNFTPLKFTWQTGYAAFSVSESQLKRVYRYILNQKKHHIKRTFENEFNGILKINNLSRD